MLVICETRALGVKLGYTQKWNQNLACDNRFNFNG